MKIKQRKHTAVIKKFA